MTAAQNEAIEKAKAILMDHFESLVIATRSTDENLKDEMNTDWHGPISDCLGMAVISQERIRSIAVKGIIA